MLNVRHSGIVVKDLDRAHLFYHKMLGLETLSERVEEGKFIETVLGMKSLKWRKYKSKEGETLLELYELDDYTNVPTAYNHVAFTTDDIKKIENEFKFFGVPYVISKDTSGTHMVMFCRDFDNNLLEIVEVL